MENGEQALEDVRSENRFLRKRVNPFKFLILSFASIILIGTFLLMLPISSASGRATSLVDALFTATSATCVTGLVVKDTGTYFSTFGQIVILLLIQIGGLGYMTTMTLLAILLKKHIPITQRIIFQENMGYPTLSQIIVFAKHVFAAVIVFEFTGALVLFLRWRYLGIAIAMKYAV
ncbi:MAG: potassium transporter TrkG, partial [Candidatus Micrarchaeia archaeon]